MQRRQMFHTAAYKVEHTSGVQRVSTIFDTFFLEVSKVSWKSTGSGV